jgi:beta-lactamase class C
LESLVSKKIDLFLKKSHKPQLRVCVWNGTDLKDATHGKQKHLVSDVFETGSVGKTFTTSLLAVLNEKKVLSLNDKVGKFRPDLSFAKNITLGQLASHTSGLPANPFKLSELIGPKSIDKVLSFNHQNYEAYLANITKVSRPSTPKYSNLGMALLGNILADSLNLTYEQAVKELLLEPLGMLDTHATANKYDACRMAKGYSAGGKLVPYLIWESMEPAGMWFSTAQDLMVFLKAHLGYSGDNWCDVLRSTTQPLSDEPKLNTFGLGWVLEEVDEIGPVIWHNGGTFGQYSMVVCALEKDLAVVILTNRREKLWHHFFSSYKLETLAMDILHLLDEINISE